MTISYDRLKNWQFAPITETYDWKDTSFYALSIGLGTDPFARDQLNFVYEPWLNAVPAMASVLANPGFWVRHPDTGIDWANSLHGEQDIVLHGTLPAQGTLIGQMQVETLVDRGEGKGALMTTRNDLRDQSTNELIASVYATAFMRSNGGFGGPSGPRLSVLELPSRAFDTAVDLPTLPQAALFYRLNGDDNPLHIDPEVAKGAGFDRPILHGLCTYGVACHALLKEVCNYDQSRISGLRVRFSAPVYPGETIRTEIWRSSPKEVLFRCLVPERDVVVISAGQLRLR